MKLTDKQEKFCQEYLLDLNATQAAIRAGYSQETANRIGSENLSKLDIQNRLQELKKENRESADDYGISRKMVIQEFANIAFGDIRDYFDDNSRLLPIKKLSDKAAAALESAEVDELWGMSPDGKIQIGDTKKVKRWNKNKALENLAKVLGYYAPEEIKHTGEVKIIEIPNNGRNDKAATGLPAKGVK